MIIQLVETLRALDPQPTAEELADALWLVEWFRTHEAAPRLFESDMDVADGRSTSLATLPARPPDPSEEATIRTPPAQPVEAGFYVARQGALTPSFLVRAPAMPAIPRPLRLSRALRPLRVTTGSPTRDHLDEADTAQRIAETGVCEPVMIPSQERRHDLALVVDTSSSMVVWRRTIEELRALFEQLGAFRDIRVWYLETDSERLSLRTGSAIGARSGRSPDELVDPTRRRIVLVVSDCIGGAWQDGRAAPLLERWGRGGPVAIAQVLPQRLWRRTAAAVEPVRVTALGSALANDRLVAVPTQAGRGGGRPPGIAIPVLELDERWLRPWAAMIAHGSRSVAGAALFTGRPVAESPPAIFGAGIGSAEERVKRFRASSSPTAFKLATFLAAAPLQLPVMRLVQQAMLPASAPAHLAEVFLGDLLRMVQPSEGSEEMTYEFHEGVREILVGGLTRREVLQVLRAVWEVVRGRVSSSLDFPALLAAIRRGERELPPDMPFAQVAASALARLGGRYREVAEQLTNGEGRPETSPTGQTSAGIGDGPAESVPADRVRILRGGVPPRNPDFTGRDQLLEAIRVALGRSMAVLTPHPMRGIGGEGKSQLAAEYAYRYAEDYDLVWWIPAEQTTSARAALAMLARQLDMPVSDDIKETVDSVLQALRDGRPYDRWLLIYDNAQAPDEIISLTPRAVGEPETALAPGRHILITSRDPGWEQHASVVNVGVFERQESIALLRRIAPQLSDAEADLLSERVADLPLAVEQAAAWQVVTGGRVDDYLQLFDERLAELPAPSGSYDLPGPLAVSVGLTLDRLSEVDPVAGMLLELWAVFGPEPVSCRLLVAGRTAPLPVELSTLLTDELRLRDAIVEISRFALGRFDEEARTLQVHRLVRTILSEWLAEEDRRSGRGHVHAILAAATPIEEPEVESTWDRRAEITPHVLQSDAFDADGPDIQRVVRDQAKFLYQSGEYEGSRALAEVALDRWEEQYGPDSELILDLSRTLANALRSVGDIKAAARRSQDTLVRMRNRFGDDHISTLFAATGFSADLRFHGDFEQAYQLDFDTWERMQHLSGHDGSDTLLVANNLGLDLRLLGEFKKAYEIDLDVRRRQEKSAHSYRQKFRAVHHLARDLHGLGRYAEAHRMQADSLERLRPVLGPGHALVLQAKMSHAGTLRKIGEFEAAKLLATETLAAHVRRFGEAHPNTLATKVCLAMATTAAGEPQQGLECIDDALAGYRRVMGDNHPFVYVCAIDRTVILRKLCELDTARRVDQASLSMLQSGGLHSDHYYALCAGAGLANDHYLLGDFEAADSLVSWILPRFRERLGSEHPYTLICAYNQQRIRAVRGMQEIAIEEAISTLEKAFGSQHYEFEAAVRGELLECDIEPTAL